jgi:hypothetical protein
MSPKNRLEHKTAKYNYDQYWHLHYSIICSKNFKSDFSSIIKARSQDFACQILKLKMSRDYSECGLTINKVEMISKQYLFNGKKLNLEDWSNIRSCAFPNISDHLFKYNH